MIALARLLRQVGRTVVPGLRLHSNLDLTPWTHTLTDVIKPFLLTTLAGGPPGKNSVVTPAVLDAAEAAALNAARSVLATLGAEVTTLLGNPTVGSTTALRSTTELRDGLLSIFANPQRPLRLAVTEHARAQNYARLQALRLAGYARKRWLLVGSSPCRRCTELADVALPLDTPFYTDPGGGPYAVVQYPPLHPWCLCEVVGAS